MYIDSVIKSLNIVDAIEKSKLCHINKIVKSTPIMPQDSLVQTLKGRRDIKAIETQWKISTSQAEQSNSEEESKRKVLAS